MKNEGKRILHLHLKKEFFEEIKEGKKKVEYRLFSDFWKKKLGEKYSEIWFYSGYPAKNDKKRILRKKIKEIRLGWIKHDLFGRKRVKVFEILFS